MMTKEELFERYKPENIDRIISYKEIFLLAFTRSKKKTFLGKDITMLNVIRLDNGYGSSFISIEETSESKEYINNIIVSVEKQLEYIPNILEIIDEKYKDDIIVKDILLNWRTGANEISSRYIFNKTDVLMSIYYPKTGETKETPLIELYNNLNGIEI